MDVLFTVPPMSKEKQELVANGLKKSKYRIAKAGEKVSLEDNKILVVDEILEKSDRVLVVDTQDPFAHWVEKNDGVWKVDAGILIRLRKASMDSKEKSSIVLSHVKKSEEFRNNRDFKHAINEIEQAEKLIFDKSSRNIDYVRILLDKAKTFMLFERLDEAEATLLKAAGISEKTVSILTDSRQPLVEAQYLAVIDELKKLALKSHQWGYHVALSFIYNILGDTEKLKQEQQDAMDTGMNRDVVLNTALTLYKVRDRKMQVLADINVQKKLVQTNPKDVKAQMRLASAYYSAGWFSESEKLVDVYLANQDKEKNKQLYTEALFLKMNLAMTQGQYDAMKKYEALIAQTAPWAIDTPK